MNIKTVVQVWLYTSSLLNIFVKNICRDAASMCIPRGQNSAKYKLIDGRVARIKIMIKLNCANEINGYLKLQTQYLYYMYKYGWKQSLNYSLP